MKRTENTASAGLYDWVRALATAVIAVIVLFTFVLRLVQVKGGSMRESLQDQDFLAVLNDPLCGEYACGDVVIIQTPRFNEGKPIVKRIIAKAGQTVEIDFSGGQVYVDGQALQEPYIREPTYTDEGLEFPLQVPEGCVFVMGDNRNGSDDSRNPALGPVDERCILGRALFVIFPGVTAETESRDLSRIGERVSSRGSFSGEQGD